MESTTACMREGEWASFLTSAVNYRFTPTEENALHFTCLLCGSLQGSIGTQEYS